MSIDLSGLKLEDILARFDSNEIHVSVITRTTKNGWQPMLAWNPIDILAIPYDDVSDPTERLELFMTQQKNAGRLVIGYLSYDVGCILHNVTLHTQDDLQTPLAYVMGFANWISFDAATSSVHAGSDSFEDEIAHIMARPFTKIPLKMYRKGLSPSWSQESYNQAYARVHNYIEAGDIYQANLTHRLEGTTDVRGIDIFRKVSADSHADFQSYIGGDNFEIISASPERFVHIADGTIQTMPVKGTRGRGANRSKDELLRRDLETSLKEKAELDMITDLMRNDLGMISKIGSVKVVERRVLTKYPTLWHAHSEICATLRDDISPIAALISLMPGGSITGCPKKRAIEIIDKVEATRRGVYTGSIFTINPSGELDSNIAIRTMIKKSDKIYLSVGGGVVYDSTQIQEYKESLQKAASFLHIDS